MTDHSIYNTQVQFIKPVSFIGITQSNINELFTGAEMRQRQLHHQSSPHDWQFTEAGDLGHTVSLLAMKQLETIPPEWLICFKPLPADPLVSTSSRSLISESSLQLVLSEGGSQQSSFYTLGERGSVDLVSFWDFLKLFWVVHLLSSRASLGDGIFQSRRKPLHHTTSTGTTASGPNTHGQEPLKLRDKTVFLLADFLRHLSQLTECGLAQWSSSYIFTWRRQFFLSNLINPLILS